MLTEAILLDISQAERQIRELERELDRLNQPVRIPVEIQGERAIAELRQDVAGADTGFGQLNQELAETDRELDRIRTSADRAGRELDTAGRRGVSSFNGMAVAAGAFGVALAAAVGIRAFVGFAGQAIEAASSFEESLSKSRVVFGSFSDDIEEFARTGPQALGLANREALAFTATFGNLFIALGLSQQEAAELSPAIVQLGADLASFNDIQVTDALEKLRSGLVGEAEPLRVLGVNINETVTQAKALELGLGGVTGELTEAEKVQARYALILEQTATAQGDFARTADGVANTQRSVRAAFGDLVTEIGIALTPAMESLLDLAPELITALEGLIPVFAGIGTSIAGIDAAGLADFVQTTSAVPTVFGTAGGAVTGFADIVVGSLQSLFDWSGGTDRAAAGVERISNAVDSFNVAKLQNGLINALQAGVDPAVALGNALVELSDLGLDTDEIAEVAEGFLRIAQVDPSRSRDLIRTLTAAAPGLNITTEELLALVGALDELQGTGSRRGRGGAPVPDQINEITDAAEAAVPAISATAAEILALAQAGKSLEDFAPDLGAEGFVNGLDALTTAMSGAQEALRDDEGEIVDDLDTFLKNLDDVFTDQLDFARNISVLRSRGLDQLADVFEEAGLEAAGALADAVSDPAAASEANAAIAAQGQALAQAEFAAFDTEIRQLIAGYEPDAVVIPLTFGGLPDIPISAITAGGIVPIPGRAGATEVTVNINNPTTNNVTTDAARASQIISSGVNASRTGPS